MSPTNTTSTTPPAPIAASAITGDTTPDLRPLARYMGKDGWRLALQHSRTDHLLIRFIRAGGHTILNGTRHALSANAALFVPAGTLFSLSPGPQSMGQVLRIPPGADILVPTTPHLLRLPQVQEQAALTRLIDAMSAEEETNAAFHGAAARAHATLLAIWLRRTLLEHAPSAAPRPDQRLAAAFAPLVAARYLANPTVAQLAQELGITATHLSRACKSASGLSAAQMLAECSLHAARTLLSDSDHPINHIASHLGFGSPAYFSRFIQRHTGHSPRDLRRTAHARRP
ncbi:helix-turn-helix transcriptional regulator [Rhodobacteraceae bacterium D3-12]|nr:helix-turn-helix transcriptional regulator [Rhodobacteraceae bacterium D3-12]